MNAFERMNTALMVDETKQIFKVSRQAFVDPAILEAERARFDAEAVGLEAAKAEVEAALKGHSEREAGRRIGRRSIPPPNDKTIVS